MNKSFTNPTYNNKKDLFKYSCVFRCPTCEITNDLDLYYQNSSILRDNDENLLIPKTVE
jgi:hypothetical protein